MRVNNVCLRLFRLELCLLARCLNEHLSISKGLLVPASVSLPLVRAAVRSCIFKVVVACPIYSDDM